MGKWIVAIIVIILAVLGWMYFTDTDVEGGAMPEVEVEGGEMPEVDVRGPEVTTGTEEVTVEVPTVDVEAPEDDADGLEDEIVDDEGLNTPDVDVEVEESEDPENR
jgi:hypothetical protein